MSDINQAIPEYLSIAAKSCAERCIALRLKGKRRDDECMAYFVGLASGARLAGNEPMARHLETVAVFAVGVRGYLEVGILASRPVLPIKAA